VKGRGKRARSAGTAARQGAGKRDQTKLAVVPNPKRAKRKKTHRVNLFRAASNIQIPTRGDDGELDGGTRKLLNAQAIRRIKAAGEQGYTYGDLSAYAQTEIELARGLFENGYLAAKDLLIALNKAGSHMATAAQLAAEAGDRNVGEVVVKFEMTSAAIAENADRAPPNLDELRGNKTRQPRKQDVIEAEIVDEDTGASTGDRIKIA